MKIQSRGERRLMGKGMLIPTTIAGLLCLLAVPVAQASAVTKPGFNGQTNTQSVGVTSVRVVGHNSATLGAANAVLTGVGASSLPISVTVGSPVLLPASSGAEYSVTTLVGIGQETGAPTAKTQFSGSSCGYDGSYSVYLCTTMYYNIKSDSFNYFADNHQDAIQATNDDPSSAVLSSLSLTTGGDGIACTGSGSLSGGQTWNISSPTSGTSYYETPSWSGTYYRLSSTYGNFQNAQGTLHWYYRGNAETLNMTFTLPDSQSGWPTGGCTN